MEGRRDSNPRRPAWENTLPLQTENICAQGDDNWQLATTQFQVLTNIRFVNAVIAVTESELLFPVTQRDLGFLAQRRVGAFPAACEVVICRVHFRLVYLPPEVMRSGRWKMRVPSCTGPTAT